MANSPIHVVPIRLTSGTSPPAMALTIRSWAASHGTAVTSTLTSRNSSMNWSASTPRLSPSVPIAHTVMSPSVLHLSAGSEPARTSEPARPIAEAASTTAPEAPGSASSSTPLKSVSVPFPGAEISTAADQLGQWDRSGSPRLLCRVRPTEGADRVHSVGTCPAGRRSLADGGSSRANRWARSVPDPSAERWPAATRNVSMKAS